MLTEPSALEPTNSPSDTTTTTASATQGVCQRRWASPKTAGTVRSRPIAKSERVTWIRVVSRVAMVESITASTMILPPAPGQTVSPRVVRNGGASLAVRSCWLMIRLTAMVTISKSANTPSTPISPPIPEFRRLSVVSSLRLAVTSQPQK